MSAAMTLETSDAAERVWRIAVTGAPPILVETMRTSLPVDEKSIDGASAQRRGRLLDRRNNASYPHLVTTHGSRPFTPTTPPVRSELRLPDERLRRRAHARGAGAEGL